jgi:hypothetical protein
MALGIRFSGQAALLTRLAVLASPLLLSCWARMFAKRFSDGKSKAEKEIKKSNKSYLIPPDSLSA